MDSDLIDRTALARLMRAIGGDADDLRDLLGDFAESAPSLVAEMQAAIAADDVEPLRRAAHTLKSNAKDFGASALAALCGEVETACKEGATAAAQAGAVAAIGAALEAAMAALTSLDLDTVGAGSG
jgi:HPt (histidine-containing phosphotransfer) domain-containing protein